MVASFECALLIAQSKKPHTIGETLIKPACVKIAEIMCGTQVASKLKTVPLSNNTVKDRIDIMADDVENTLVEKLKMHPFSIQLDETFTVVDEAVLIAYVQYIEDAEIKQDNLLSTNLSTTTRGEDIFHSIDTYFTKQNIPYNNLVAWCTDGAASVMGKNKGYNAHVKEKAPHCLVFHCMIHHQAQASKHLSDELNEMLKTAVKIVNFIKAHPVNKRIFAELCEDEAHQTLLLHTEVRWLSRGQVTSYLADIFSLYNETNKRMQSAEANILECKEIIDSFVHKVEFRKNKLMKRYLQSFPSLLKQTEGNLPESLRKEFTRHMELLQEEMKSRLSDVDEHVAKCTWVMDPFTAKEEDVEYLEAEDELLDVKTNSLLKRFFTEHGYKRFWLVKGPDFAPKLVHHATTRLILPFATTYLSETAFSSLVTIKTKALNKLDLYNDFRLAVTKIMPAIQSLAQEMQAQDSH
ncbi:protein ZBED8 [Myxocyprinus asiaticus]|uniref:protein ZBED8 n=1 Tax=Myxocyprinus asiaticus TaxID=70543 RepID=UPI0022214A00|nr:protein ZBED8 [Myxocyprinus asiaticus]